MKVKVRIIERYAKTIIVDTDKETEFEACEEAEDIASRLYEQSAVALNYDDYSDGYAEVQGVAT